MVSTFSKCQKLKKIINTFTRRCISKVFATPKKKKKNISSVKQQTDQMSVQPVSPHCCRWWVPQPMRTVLCSASLILWPTAPAPRKRRGDAHMIPSASCRSTTLPLLLFSTSSFHRTHGIPQYNPHLANNQEMSSLPYFPAHEIRCVIAWPAGPWTKTCATLCLCYPGSSEIRHKDVVACSDSAELRGIGQVEVTRRN